VDALLDQRFRVSKQQLLEGNKLASLRQSQVVEICGVRAGSTAIHWSHCGGVPPVEMVNMNFETKLSPSDARQVKA
jgi:hypothetical protein